MIKKVSFISVSMILCAALISIFIALQTETTHAVTSMKVTVKAKSDSTVSLSWKKKSVSKYVIYRQTVSEDGKYGKMKKITSLKGSKKSYTDKKAKKNTQYEYTVKGYKKKGKKYKLTYRGSMWVYNGLAKPSWHEYLFDTYPSAVDKLVVAFQADNSLKPTGFKVYRKRVSGGSYERVAIVKASGLSGKYTDKSVLMNEGYVYKVRSYYKTKKKTIHSAYSEPVTRYAVKYRGSYDTTLITAPTDNVTSIVVKISSEDGVGNLELKSTSGFYCNWFTTEDDNGYLLPEKYSYDGEDWTAFPEEDPIILGARSTIFVSFKAFDGASFPYPSEANAAGTEINMSSDDCRYNNMPSYFEISFNRAQGITYPNLEAIH